MTCRDPHDALQRPSVVEAKALVVVVVVVVLMVVVLVPVATLLMVIIRGMLVPMLHG